MMKPFFVLLMVLCLCVTNAISQAITPSAKVQAAYTPTELAAMSSEEIDYLNFLADKGYTIHQKGKETDSLPLLSSVTKSGHMLNAENFNPLLLQVLPNEASQFFRIDGTEMVVQLHSSSWIAKIFNQFKINRAKAQKQKSN